MKNTIILFLITCVVIPVIIGIQACHTSKKTTTSTVSASTTNLSTPTPTLSEQETLQSLLYLQKNQPKGVNPPGDAEINALKAQYQDVTLARLQEGYAMYAHGKCINCHTAKNIYLIDDGRCKLIIENMSQAAQITDSQREAVYMYVLSIKATKPK